MSTGVGRILGRPTAGVLLFMLALLGAFALAAPATAAPTGLTFSATLNGRNVSSISSNDPLSLSSQRPLVVALTVTNHSSRAVGVGVVRIQGRVMGLSFFSYDTQVALRVPAGDSQRTTFSVGLADLAGQATGLLPTSVALLDDNSDALATRDFAVDVSGDLTSIYGVFGLAVAALTVLWLVSLIYRVVRRSLPANRWTRAVQFAVAGFGVGLSLTFTVSALSLLTPNAVVWAPFVFGAGAVGFLIGYLTPGPRVVDADEEEQFIASRQRAYAGALGAGTPGVAIGAGAEAAPDAQRPWQGEIQRSPLGLPAPLPAWSPGPGVDDRETTDVDPSQLDAFFRPDHPRPEQRPDQPS